MYFLKVFNQKTNKKILAIADDALELLKLYPWPGNIRELKNVLERSVILQSGTILTTDSLPLEITANSATTSTENSGKKTLSAFSMAAAEKLHIQKVLNYTGGNKAEAARLLGIGIATLYRKVEEYSLQS